MIGRGVGRQISMVSLVSVVRIGVICRFTGMVS